MSALQRALVAQKRLPSPAEVRGLGEQLALSAVAAGAAQGVAVLSRAVAVAV